jgi:hypothetical protein
VMCILQQLTMERQSVTRQDIEKCVGKDKAESAAQTASFSPTLPLSFLDGGHPSAV